MPSKDPDDNCNTETEEETIALTKKRARRVSFAETTAVHFFDRDEESEKKSPSTEDADGGLLRRTESEEIRKLLRDNGVSAEEEGEDDDDELLPSKPFFRPMESPSPASSVFGSATSNDEENFFGPISTDFIKHGLSNSAGTDENHDITMDSTTFSMHFRSLAKSDSGGDIKTPTGFRLAFGESSPTQTVKSNIGSLMVLTSVKSPAVHPSPAVEISNALHTSPAVEKSTGSCTSNDMSLVKENSDRYDYGRLSPGLDALLAEGQKDVTAVSSSSQLENLISIDYPTKDSECDSVYQNGTPLNLMNHTPKIPTEPVTPSHVPEEETNVPYAQSPVDQRVQDISFNKECSPMSGKLGIDTNPVQMNDVSTSGESVGNAEKIRKRKAEFDPLATLSDLNSENEVGTFLIGSISSLNAKKRQLFKDLTTSTNHHWNSALLQKQPGSFHKKGSDRIISSLPPLPGKSVSRLKWLRNSPSASFYGDGGNHPRVTISGTASRSNSKNSILDGKTLNHQFRHVGVPVACLEEQFSSASRDCEKKSMNTNDVQMLDQTVAMRQSSRDGNVIKEDRTPIPSTGSVSTKEGTIAGASPLQIRSVGKQDHEHLSSTVNSAEVNLNSSGSDSSLLEVTLNNRKYVESLPSEMEFESAVLESPSKGRHSIAIANTAVGSSSATEEELATSECMEYQQSNPETLKPPLAFTLQEGMKSIASVTEAYNSTSETENPGLLIDGGISESGLASKVDFVSEIKINQQKTVLKNIQLNGETPIRHRVPEQHQCSSANKSIKTASRSIIAGEELPLKSQSYQQEEYLHSSREVQCSSPHDYEVLEMRTDDPTLDSYQHSPENACSTFQNASDKRDESYSLEMKNMRGKLGADMEEAADILRKHKHFPNDSNQSGELHSRCFNGISSLTQNIEGDKGQQSLTDVLKNFNLETGKWLFSSVVKLDTHSAEKLEDITANLQKFAASKIICSDIYSQKVSKEYDHAQLKRVAETKLLMYKALYGRVKLQFMHLQKKQLLNQIELVQSAVQESKLLRSKCCCKLHGSGQQDNGLGGCNSQSYSADQDKNKDKGNSISVLKKDLEDSKSKIENLTSSFDTSIKIRGQPNYDKTVAILMDHFKRKAPCWILRHNFQMWEVDKAENKNGQLDVVLNYDRIISQRFKRNHKPKSSISISSELINTRILKTWPQMNAAAAFEFALSGKTLLKYTGPVIFARETQRISSLLSNLRDVLEEIKLAHIELSNLAKSSFHLPSAGKLVLQLIFINYNGGGRVVLSFDMSCLNCGVYPCDIIPYEVGNASNEKQKLISESILDEIKSAIAGLQGGYLRFLRLSRCVSNVVQFGSHKR